MITISVALCTYNGAAYVEDQLRSILQQTRQPSEIIVSDDASTDATLSLVERVFAEWCDNHSDVPELRILRNAAALGVTANFEQALSGCSGELISLCDQDDVWAADRLDIMAEEFCRRGDLQLLHTDARLVDGAGTPLGHALLETLRVSPMDLSAVHKGQAIDVLLRRNIVTGATTMIRRELLVLSRPFPTAWVHDEWLAVVAAIAGEMDVLELPLLDYRQHGNNEIGVTGLRFRGRLERLTAPRTVRNARLLARAQALADRVSQPGFAASARICTAVAQKLEHERQRSELPRRRPRRIRPVLAEWRTGRYERFGLGLQDVVRDLLQPI